MNDYIIKELDRVAIWLPTSERLVASKLIDKVDMGIPLKWYEVDLAQALVNMVLETSDGD